MPDVQNTSAKSVSIIGTIELIVQIGTSRKAVNFLITETFATSVIFVCNFFDIHGEAITPRLTIFEMDGGSMAPIIRQPFKPNTTVPIPDEQCFTTQKERANQRKK